MVQSDRPDLAILDIWMPRVNGLDAAERIAAIDPGVRVILFTNNNDLCLRDPRSAFAEACVEKGGDFTELKRTIVSVLASCGVAEPVRAGSTPIGRRIRRCPACGPVQSNVAAGPTKQQETEPKRCLY